MDEMGSILVGCASFRRGLLLDEVQRKGREENPPALRSAEVGLGNRSFVYTGAKPAAGRDF